MQNLVTHDTPPQLVNVVGCVSKQIGKSGKNTLVDKRLGTGHGMLQLMRDQNPSGAKLGRKLHNAAKTLL